jgi:hypothetical protein
MGDGDNTGNPADDDDASLERALAEIAAMDPKTLTNDVPTPVSDDEVAELLAALDSIPDPR